MIVEYAPGGVVDELPERRMHRRLVHARLLHVAADAIQLRSAVLLGSESRVPIGTVQNDQRDVAQRLDVVDRGRTLVETGDRWKRRLETRLRTLAFERLDERRLLARLVRSGAAVHEDVAVEARTEDVLAEKAGPVRFLDGLLDDELHVIELAPYIDVSNLRPDRVAADGAPFDQQVGIALHEHVVLERARLALVGVAADVLRPGGVLEDELPFEPGWKSGAAAATQTGGFHTLDHVVRPHGRHGRAERLVAARVLDVEVERERIRLANVLRQDWFERHAGVYCRNVKWAVATERPEDCSRRPDLVPSPSVDTANESRALPDTKGRALIGSLRTSSFRLQMAAAQHPRPRRPQSLDERHRALRRQALVPVVIHHHDRRPVAGAETF